MHYILYYCFICFEKIVNSSHYAIDQSENFVHTVLNTSNEQITLMSYLTTKA